MKCDIEKRCAGKCKNQCGKLELCQDHVLTSSKARKEKEEHFKSRKKYKRGQDYNRSKFSDEVISEDDLKYDL